MKIPEEFLTKMERLMEPEEYHTFITELKRKIMIHSLRVNTKKISVAEFRRIFPYELTPVPWCAEGFYYPKGVKLSKHPYYYAGLYYLQDPSAMLPVVVLAPQPGERILDLCSAPGGKATQIGAATNDQGLLWLNDINPKRTKALLKNVENFGLKNIVVTNNQPRELAAAFPAFFDRVLVDAPCSGEGMFRREPRLMIAWRRDYHPRVCVPIQAELLKDAAQMVAPGGRLVYSTCTFSPEENELQVKEFLAQHPDFRLVGIDREGVSLGRAEWAGDVQLRKTARIWPHRARGEGQFAAVLERTTSGEQPERSVFSPPQPAASSLEPFWDFCREVGIAPPSGRLFREGDDLFLLPTELPDLTGLNPVRCGLFLGELRYNRFLPSHPFALALERQEARRELALAPDSPEVIKYLKGETLLATAATPRGNGWLLVTTGGFPLGWAKRVGNLVKNNYPPAWRMK
ncbi:MAG TPA: SAM-dependent methyltransferase [Firmicutes bacterium]|nr:SAM-dependent methyltransferase [Bacillota bacterium]